MGGKRALNFSDSRSQSSRLRVCIQVNFLKMTRIPRKDVRVGESVPNGDEEGSSGAGMVSSGLAIRLVCKTLEFPQSTRHQEQARIPSRLCVGSRYLCRRISGTHRCAGSVMSVTWVRFHAQTRLDPTTSSGSTRSPIHVLAATLPHACHDASFPSIRSRS